MTKAMLGLLGASILALVACGDGDGSDVQGEDDAEELAQRTGPGLADSRRCSPHEDARDKSGGKDAHANANAKADRGHQHRCDGDDERRDHRDGSHADAARPRPTHDAGTPPRGRDAGGPVVAPPRDPSGGPVIVDDPNVVKLPDGTVVRLDGSCPSFPTPFSVTLPGCCLPTGTCGLSTHAVDVAGVPKGCFSYAQGKMLDPSFNLPEKRCTVR